jgi:cytochrome c5|tara:strand:+ start:46804 stop:47439 length:636 start_codon:yes stop_codon:yes gene_type:complete
MKHLIWKSANKLGRKSVLLLLTALATQSLYALDYPEAGDVAQGSKTWSENCARCHNMRSPSDLRDDQWVASVFHMRVRAGLTGQEMRDVLTFLQNSNTRATSVNAGQAEATTTTKAASAAASSGYSGKQVYENSCVACHGASGKGSIPGAPDFTDKNGRLSKGDSELLSNIITGIQSPGSPMPMPARGGNSELSDAELNAALQYIKASFFE